MIKKRDCETQDGLNLRIKQIEKEAGVRCGAQAFSSEKEALSICRSIHEKKAHGYRFWDRIN
jgi:hypothetical protein